MLSFYIYSGILIAILGGIVYATVTFYGPLIFLGLLFISLFWLTAMDRFITWLEGPSNGTSGQLGLFALWGLIPVALIWLLTFITGASLFFDFLKSLG